MFITGEVNNRWGRGDTLSFQTTIRGSVVYEQPNSRVDEYNEQTIIWQKAK